jgi:hypothetical protein
MKKKTNKKVNLTTVIEFLGEFKNVSKNRYTGFIQSCERSHGWWDEEFHGLNRSKGLTRFLSLPEVRQDRDRLFNISARHEVKLELGKTFQVATTGGGGATMEIAFTMTGKAVNIAKILKSKRTDDIFRLSDYGKAGMDAIMVLLGHPDYEHLNEELAKQRKLLSAEKTSVMTVVKTGLSRLEPAMHKEFINCLTVEFTNLSNK